MTESKTSKVSLNILITGANGNIAKVARDLFRSHKLILLSRTYCECSPNEIWIQSASLEFSEWWRTFSIGNQFDLVLHLAEPVRVAVPADDIPKIVESHTAFLETISSKAKIVLYPRTALIYDARLMTRDLSYIRIKNEVLRNVATLVNVVSPVIHPIVDSGPGLCKLIGYVKKFPMVNIFCAFNATIPVLCTADLRKELLALNKRVNLQSGDWYSYNKTVAEVFNNNHKLNVYIIGKFVHFVVSKLTFHPRISLLIFGRKLP